MTTGNVRPSGGRFLFPPLPRKTHGILCFFRFVSLRYTPVILVKRKFFNDLTFPVVKNVYSFCQEPQKAAEMAWQIVQ